MSLCEQVETTESTFLTEAEREALRAKRVRKALATKQRREQAIKTKAALQSVLGPMLALLRVMMDTGEQSATRQLAVATFEAWVRVHHQAKFGRAYDAIPIDVMLAKLRFSGQITQSVFVEAVEVFNRLSDASADDLQPLAFVMNLLEAIATEEYGLDAKGRARRRNRFLREGNRLVNTFDVCRNDEREQRLAAVEYQPITQGTHHRIHVCRNGATELSGILKPFENTESGLRLALGAIAALQPVLMHDERLALVSFTMEEPQDDSVLSAS